MKKPKTDHHGKLAIFGSRTLDDVRVLRIIAEAVNEHSPEYIITSGATEGVCEQARKFCKTHAVPLKLHFLDETRCAGKYHHRSVAVLKECDFCLFIHDGESSGTKNEIKVAEKLKKPFVVKTIAPEHGELDQILEKLTSGQ
jgi:hypothetical protein